MDGRDVVRLLQHSGLRVRLADRAAQRIISRDAYLRSEWSQLGRLTAEFRTSQQEEWNALGEELLGYWRQTHRSYHDERHLEDVLLALDQLTTLGETIEAPTLLATWFHDAVYEGVAEQDETASAELAHASLQRLQFDDGTITDVHSFIIATAPGQEIAQPPLPLVHLLDADLSIFSASPSRYQQYAEGVRAEYLHVAEQEFAHGRSAILQTYLDLPTIYRTTPAQQLWETRARVNIAQEIGTLLGR